MPPYDATPDPDDFFQETRMSFGDHLEELRSHLLRAIYGFLVGMLAALVVGHWVLQIISAPVEQALGDYNRRAVGRRVQVRQAAEGERFGAIPVLMERNAFRAEAGQPPADVIELGHVPAAFAGVLRRLDVDLPEATLEAALRDRYRGHLMKLTVRVEDPEATLNALRTVLSPSTLKTMNVTEAMFVYFKVCLLTGFVLASPWVFYQVWAFIAAGLYPHEKRLVNVYLPFSAGLFLVGVIACQLFIMPRAVEAMLWFNEWLGFEPDLRLNEWLGFALMLPVVFGLSFQTPIVMTFLNKIGVVSVETFHGKRRMAWFVMLIVAAVITPTIDPLTMMSLWVPMGFLYEFGILLCIYQKNESPFEDLEASESEELIEV